MEEMERLRITRAGLKNMLERGASGQGRRCSISYLRRTGLIGEDGARLEQPEGILRNSRDLYAHLNLILTAVARVCSSG